MANLLTRLFEKPRKTRARSVRLQMSPFQRQRLRELRRLQASIDSAQTTNENRRHWTNADYLSANASYSAKVRRTLRARSRYEVDNNSHLRGILNTHVNYVIGEGPRLQIASDNEDLNNIIEDRFAEWAEQIDLVNKLRIMRFSQCASGESFGLLATNPSLQRFARFGRPTVQLDLKVIEADQIATPWGIALEENDLIDGLKFDAFGNVIGYYLLKAHPGDMGRFASLSNSEYDLIPAEFMIHQFKAMRPGQNRGIPEITPALPLFSLLRRYTLAVLGSAEQAANVAGVLHSEMPPGGIGDEEEVNVPLTLDTIEMERNMWLTLPEGWDITQLRAEQPVTTFGDFKRQILNEAARCVGQPYNLAAGDSSDYNYASGRLDHQSYFLEVGVDRHGIELRELNPLVRMWFEEGVRVSGYFPQAVRSTNFRFRHQWFWMGQDHVDPVKGALSRQIDLTSGCTTLARVYAEQGLDWEREILQRAREVELMRNKQIPIPDLKIDPDMVGLGVDEQ